MDNLEHKKYPLGKFLPPEKISDQDLDRHIKIIIPF
jgi:hypothetical protein